MEGGDPSDVPETDLPPVQQVALEAIHTLRAFLDLAEVAVTDPELRGQMMTLGRDAWEALLPPEQRANLLATIATVVQSFGTREGTQG